MGASAILAFLLLLLALYLISRPLILPTAAPPADDESTSLDGQKDRLVDAIRELDMDHATGKLSDADYQELRNSYKAEAALVMKELRTSASKPVSEEAASAPPDAAMSAAPAAALGHGNGRTAPAQIRAASAEPGGVPPLDEEIERMIAARKSSLEGSRCPTCDGDRAPDDRFCRTCGTHLHSPTSDGHAPEGFHG